MLKDEQIIEHLGVLEILHKYPASGQKQVLTVRHAKYATVILKIVHENTLRIEREISVVQENNFLNVPKIFDVQKYNIDDKQGICFFEEYIEGITLRENLKIETLNINDALKLAENLLKTIVQMEEKRIVHRDIKPENIIKGSEQWFLIDFGIVRVLDQKSLTMTNAVRGPHTPGYGPPELFEYSKKDIDSRSDLFSLGVVLFESLTGNHPFIKGDEESYNEIWYNTVTIVPNDILIPGDVDMQFIGLIQTFMQKHISRRPPNAKKALEWFYSVRNTINERG